MRAEVEHDLALGQLIHDLRTGAGLSQRELAERMGTIQSVISRLEEGGGAKNRIDTLARVAEALGRHLIVSFPEKAPAKLEDAVQVPCRPLPGSAGNWALVGSQAHRTSRLAWAGRPCAVALRRPDASTTIEEANVPVLSVDTSPDPTVRHARTRSIAMLSTFPPRLCGLATFADALSAAVERTGCRVIRVPVETDHPPTTPADTTARSDRRRRADATSAALAEGEVAIVQHEFGIFGGRDGDEVIDVLTSLAVPAIVVLHSVPAQPTDHQRQVMEAVCAAAGRVVVMAVGAGERLLSSYDVDPSRVVMIPHGATLPVAPIPVPPPAPTRPLQLLTWGLLGHGKGIEHVVTALSMLRDVTPRVRYTVAGATHPNVFAREGDRYRHSLSRRSWALGVAGSVEFDDRYRDVPSLVRFVESHSMVVLPYDSRDQATSGVLVDAIAAGRPVIATAFPHAVELLSDGAGIVVPHRDPSAIATAIRSVLRDPERLTAMAARAGELAPQFSWDAVATRYLERCDELQPVASRRAS